jgi:hypothetical protein
MRSSDNTGWAGIDPGWLLGVPIPAGDPVEETLEYHVAYPDGSTEPLPQAQAMRAVSVCTNTE